MSRYKYARASNWTLPACDATELVESSMLDGYRRDEHNAGSRTLGGDAVAEPGGRPPPRPEVGGGQPGVGRRGPDRRGQLHRGRGQIARPRNLDDGRGQIGRAHV